MFKLFANESQRDLLPKEMREALLGEMQVAKCEHMALSFRSDEQRDSFIRLC